MNSRAVLTEIPQTEFGLVQTSQNRDNLIGSRFCVAGKPVEGQVDCPAGGQDDRSVRTVSGILHLHHDRHDHRSPFCFLEEEFSKRIADVALDEVWISR